MKTRGDKSEIKNHLRGFKKAYRTGSAELLKLRIITILCLSIGSLLVPGCLYNGPHVAWAIAILMPTGLAVWSMGKMRALQNRLDQIRRSFYVNQMSEYDT